MRTRGARKLCLLAFVSCVLLASSYGGKALARQDEHGQKLCPVMGGKIDRSAYVGYDGKRVYFCCSGCKETFLQNPEKYIKDMESQGIVLDKVPKPESGEGHGHRTGNEHAESMD